MTYKEKKQKEQEIIDKIFNLLSKKENQEGFKLTFNKRGRKDAERVFKSYLSSMVYEIQVLNFDYRKQFETKKEPLFTDKEIDNIINEALSNE